MKEKWEDWIGNGEAEFTEKGNRKRTSYQLVAEWADDTWKKVATDELIIKGFRQCGYADYDGETSNLHSRLQETIKKREVPEEVIREGDILRPLVIFFGWFQLSFQLVSGYSMY